MEELEASQVQVSESSSLDMHREELDEPLDLDDLVEPIEQVYRPFWMSLSLRGNLPGVERLCRKQNHMVLHLVHSGKVKDLKGLQVM
jgi:hypothetical protein